MSNLPVKPVKIEPSVKLLTDEPEKERLLHFNKYEDVLYRFVVESDPRFSIGIYGEWGTGKTTLMQMLADRLRKEKDILVIWFNAWKYERDKNLILISLLKSIVFGMQQQSTFKKLRRIILGTIVDFDKGIADRFALNEKTEDIFLKEKNSIYFEGIEKIENELKDIRAKNKKLRIVVFIDDLDRCSPNRAVEIFESIKGFLDIPGLIYVMGLSYETIAKFLSVIYKDIGIKGENYIQKIIQIPILIPEWKNEDIEILTRNLSPKLGTKYSELIANNQKLISYGVESNPRELKRFINSFILSAEIYFDDKEIISSDSPKSKQYTELLVVQAMRSRWNKFTRIFTDYKINKKVIAEIINEKDEKREALELLQRHTR